jgi:hypothetical protein
MVDAEVKAERISLLACCQQQSGSDKADSKHAPCLQRSHQQSSEASTLDLFKYIMS